MFWYGRFVCTLAYAKTNASFTADVISDGNESR